MLCEYSRVKSESLAQIRTRLLKYSSFSRGLFLLAYPVQRRRMATLHRRDETGLKRCKRCSLRDRGLGFETAQNRNFAVVVLALVVLVLVLKDRCRPFSRPINNLLACMRRKMIILFAQVNNKDCNFYKLH